MKSNMRLLICYQACCAIAIFPVTSDRTQAADVEQWGVMELVFRGPREGNPYVDVHVRADFTHDGELLRVGGFYDGDGSYKICFSPPSQGAWKYQTASNCPDLNGHRGEFTAGPPSTDNHGPVQVFQKCYLQYADGSSYHQFGTTCYAWIHQSEELQRQTLETLAASPFNKIRFCIFPKSYAYNQNEPALFAFLRKPDGAFDFDRPDPAFWGLLEQRILDLQRLGVQADVILWHPYDRWGFADMSDTQDDRYLRYCIARLSVHRNVWWSLANEFDFMTDRPAGHRGNKQMEDWDRFFRILHNEDAHARLRGIHNGRVWYDHTRDWVTHASLQTSDMAGGIGYRSKYQKPVIYDECRYEGDIPQGWGNLDARTMTQRFWLGTLSGCYVGHGETYLHPRDILWWSKGGVLHGESPQRIAWLKEILGKAPPFHELEPLGDEQGRYLLAKAGEYYLLYCANTAPQTLDLSRNRSYKVDLIDPWEMSVLPLGSAEPGDYTVRPVQPDVAYRFTPYASGERRRPEMKIEASVTEGVGPLSVTFRSHTDVSVAWAFGDGTVSTENPVTHIFEQPGLYRVTLRATGPDEGSAVDLVQIAVDSDNEEPIVRVGYSDGESASVSFHGTARVGQDGSFVLPDAQPWGRVQVGESVQEELRGLRSFTIMGWVKPDSLDIGSGGNRILFCLNKDRAGIDLVCHPDGRLRMSVNQWPDSVQNDSSPGKLVVGKWTRFAVTYDATKRSDNVCWHFSPPRDRPDEATLTLDRVTTYNMGPVAGDVGPLAIGNFNETMRDYGWDRQFRGEIRNVEIYGSRVSSRGALPLAERLPTDH